MPRINLVAKEWKFEGKHFIIISVGAGGGGVKGGLKLRVSGARQEYRASRSHRHKGWQCGSVQQQGFNPQQPRPLEQPLNWCELKVSQEFVGGKQALRRECEYVCAYMQVNKEGFILRAFRGYKSGFNPSVVHSFCLISFYLGYKDSAYAKMGRNCYII